MTLTATPHLNFRGNARAALAFYQAAFDGALTLVSYQDAGQPHPAEEANHVMWGQVATPGGLRVMAFDAPASLPWHAGENAYYVTVGSNTTADIAASWDKMQDGATILQALAPAPWSPLYGMLKDRFGVTWVFSVAGAA
ncbi:VOC family protein [Massilia sp. S19_KUP03_FR1]|uniref:VOC family protein n=1 Tax=Massilia sp. S19_KUP03_FR1 TaxID=3025503 RepID=UPI002FCD90D5